jgi:alanine racemase
MREPRCWVEVSLARIAENFRAVRDLVGPGVEVMPVVKADAYGHGAVAVSRALEREGARRLAVSSVQEGVVLRDAGIGAGILVMAGVLASERDELIARGLTPVVHDLADLAALDRLATARGVALGYHLKIDTGMGRLGTRAAAASIGEAARSCPHLRCEGLMTHFASAADYASGQTDGQIERFDAVAAALAAGGMAPECLHAASTISIAYGRREAWRNLVRPGHAIYGYVSPARGPAPRCELRVKPALSWRARILAVKDAPSGTLIGYGGLYRTAHPARVGVIAAGYADGIPHRLSNRGSVIAGGRLAPIIGAVSMDLTTVDLTACPALGPGDAVTLLGEEGGVSLDARQIARTAGTLSYDVLCRISARVARLYRDD